MTTKQKDAQKKRTSTFKERNYGGVGHVRKNPMDAQSLAIMGKGMARSFIPVKCAPWTGAGNIVIGSYDIEQALKNKELGYW